MKTNAVEPTRQYPKPPNVWLTKLDDPEREESRLFTDWAIIPSGQPLWGECTQEFYDEWQAEYNPPEPEPEPEEETK